MYLLIAKIVIPIVAALGLLYGVYSWGYSSAQTKCQVELLKIQRTIDEANREIQKKIAEQEEEYKDLVEELTVSGLNIRKKEKEAREEVKRYEQLLKDNPSCRATADDVDSL